MKISESLYMNAEIYKKKEKISELAKEHKFQDSSDAVISVDGDSYEKSAAGDEFLVHDNNYNEYFINRNDYKSRWTPEKWDQFYQDHFESFRYTDLNGEVSVIKAPEKNADIEVDAHGRPMTRIKALLRGGRAVTQFTNDHYSKYITLPNIVKDEDFIRALGSIITEKDYAGMSDADKYKTINEKYAQVFGNDFLLAEAVDYAAPHAPYRYHMVLDQYHNDLTAAIGSSDSITQAARTALYGDMSDADIRADISAKYPSGDQMTLRELYHMTWEMEQVGVDEGMRDVLKNTADFLSHISCPGGPSGFTITIADRNRLRESMLDQKLDIGFLGNAYNKMVKAGTVTGGTGQIMQEHLGMSLDQNGKATNEDSGTSKWFQTIVDWLSSDDIVRVK